MRRTAPLPDKIANFALNTTLYRPQPQNRNTASSQNLIFHGIPSCLYGVVVVPAIDLDHPYRLLAHFEIDNEIATGALHERSLGRRPVEATRRCDLIQLDLCVIRQCLERRGRQSFAQQLFHDLLGLIA
jgi:hypothetical protein